jgi:hypothetical protein
MKKERERFHRYSLVDACFDLIVLVVLFVNELTSNFSTCVGISMDVHVRIASNESFDEVCPSADPFTRLNLEVG